MLYFALSLLTLKPFCLENLSNNFSWKTSKNNFHKCEKIFFWKFFNYLKFFLGLQGQFNYVNIVIRPLDHESNAVTLQAKEGTS